MNDENTTPTKRDPKKEKYVRAVNKALRNTPASELVSPQIEGKKQRMDRII